MPRRRKDPLAGFKPVFVPEKKKNAQSKKQNSVPMTKKKKGASRVVRNRPPVASGRVTGPGPKLKVNRPLAGDGISVVLRGVYSVTNTALNTCAFYTPLGAVSGAGPVHLGLTVSKLNNFYAMYDWSRIRHITFTYRPQVAFSTVGWVGMAIDPQPRAVAPTGVSSVSRHYHSFVGDVKEPAILSIDQSKLSTLGGNSLTWYLNDTSADIEWRVPGVFQMYSSNDQANGVLLGQLEVTAVMEFKGLTES
jgi:hypothetical protein